MADGAAQAHRIKGLDGLRGIAAISVLLFHYTVVYGQLIGPIGPLPFVATYGRHGVDLFFIISGFVILMTVENSRTLADFVVSRFARLFPAFWAAVSITSCALIISPLLPTFWSPGPGTIAANLTMMPVLFHAHLIDGAYWSLFYELMFYVLMGLICRFRLAHRIEPICLLWIAIFSVVRWLDPELGWRTRQILLVHYGHLFIVGICIYRIWGGRSGPLTYVVLALACGMSLFGPGPESGIMPPGLYFAITLACAGAVWLASANRFPFLRTRPLLFLGGISYPVYMLHQIIGFEVIRLALGGGLSSTMALSLAAGVTILLATAINILIERPARDWIRRLYAGSRHRLSKPHAAQAVSVRGDDQRREAI
jgi:peptidoglycan/LPS O-acetylase OafA/YrhL